MDLDTMIVGIRLAATYGLVAVGLSLTLAGLGFLNLAHGATFAVSGYFAFVVSEHVSTNGLVLVLAGAAAGCAAGAVIWAAVYLPLEGKPNWDMRSITATLALSLVGTYALLQLLGSYGKPMPPIFGSHNLELGQTVVTPDQWGSIVSAVVVLLLVVVAITKSRLGLGLRALTQNTIGAQLVGIDRRSLALGILAISGSLAGLAATLLSQTIYVSWDSGYTPLVRGMIVALLGGLGSIRGTIIAALLVGVLEAETSRYLGQGRSLMTLFILITVVLLVRPRGIAGVLQANRA